MTTYAGRFGEIALHRHVGELLETYERLGRLVAWPVPNGALLGGSDKTQRARRAARMKADRQIRPGVSDWCVLLSGGQFLAIELKVGKNSETAEQTAFALQIERMGGRSHVCRTVDAVLALLGPAVPA